MGEPHSRRRFMTLAPDGRRSRPGLALLLAPVLLVTAVGPAKAQEPPDSVPAAVTPARMAEGYRLYHEHSCRNCHGELARGGVGGPSLRDLDWLHVEGERVAGAYLIPHDGIVDLILWGVRADDLDATTRPWAMLPRGGTDLTAEQVEAIAAYVWGQYYGFFEASEEDFFVDLILDRPVAEARERINRHQEENGGAVPVGPERFHRVAVHAFNIRPRLRGLAIAELGLEYHPDSPALLYLHSDLLNIFAVGDNDAGLLRRAIEAAETALRTDPDHPNAERTREQLRELRGRGGGGGERQPVSS